MNQKERKQIQLKRHYQALERLASFCGVDSANGKKLSNKLRRIEIELQKPLLDFCNGDFIGTYDDLDKITDNAEKEIQKLFNNKLQGLHINRDPRGYALKIDDEVNRTIYKDIDLNRDWGGYGLLAPEITGK